MFQQVGQLKSLPQQVEDELTNAIRSGKYVSGQKIPTENELCKIFNVSRTSIREAIKKMNAKGIIEVRKGSGAYVSEMSIKNTSEILNLFFELSTNKNIVLETIGSRQLIEPEITAQAAKLRTSKHLNMLENNMQAMQSCSIDDKKKEAELDNEFHRILLSTSANSVLGLLLNPIFNLIPKFKTMVFAKPIEGDLLYHKNIMLTHHGNILNAIKNKDESKAKKAMQDHLLETRNNYILSIKKQ